VKKEGEELQELVHEAVPGFRTVFYIVMAIAGSYLALILFKTI
jgi:hypothetical protein